MTKCKICGKKLSSYNHSGMCYHHHQSQRYADQELKILPESFLTWWLRDYKTRCIKKYFICYEGCHLEQTDACDECEVYKSWYRNRTEPVEIKELIETFK